MSSAVVATAVATTIATAAGVPQLGVLTEVLEKHGPGGGTTRLQTLLILVGEEGVVVHVPTEDLIAVSVVLLGEEDVGMPHLVDVAERRDFLPSLQEGELEKAPVILFGHFAPFLTPTVLSLEFFLDTFEVKVVDDIHG